MSEEMNKKEVERVSVSFSGGRTSGMMAYLVNEWAKRNNKQIVFTFANTGLEHEGTYKFIKDVEDNWGIKVVWLESIISPTKGEGVRAKVVNYETATRGGALFEEMVKKHGLPNSATPHCTTYLKVYLMRAYLRDLGWKAKTYHTAIGIRADEIDRCNSKMDELKIWYPLADLGITKADVDAFWSKQSFKLDIPEHYGNCKTCWKKSWKKLYEIYHKTPEEFDFFLQLEAKYKETNTFGKGPRALFRGGTSTEKLLENARLYIAEKYTPEDLDANNGCEESCEVYSEDNNKILFEEEK